ncbi:unnamed protein product [Cochlearia groenlandica]
MAATRELCNLIRDREEEEEVVWVGQYSSKHEILLVGEGDFSFSLSLAARFGSASNISASSLDSYDDVVRKYNSAKSNLYTLKRLGANLLHGVDATKLHLHPLLLFTKFHIVIFNFPHAGFHGKESHPSLIRKHRELVFGFFHAAVHMLRADGQVHVSHKNKAPFCHWNLEELASRCSLALIQSVAFDKRDYPGYENKRGDGSRCDKPFLLGECTTFKFRFSRVAKELYAEKVKLRVAKEVESTKCTQAFTNYHEPVSFDHDGYPLHTEFQSVRQRPALFDISNHQDHNFRKVQDHFVQSRQRKSPLDLSYYQERSQYEDVFIRETERSAFLPLERNHAGFLKDFLQFEKLGYSERSSLSCQDFQFQAHHHRQEHFHECSNRFNGVSLDIYNEMIQNRSYIRESQERSRLLCGDFLVPASEKPLFEHSNRSNGIYHETYNMEGRRMLTYNTTGESRERSLTRRSYLDIYPPQHW